MLRAILSYLFPKGLLTGKMITTAYNSRTGRKETLVYSPYAEYEFMSSDKRLFVRFVNTYGFERIPHDHLFINAPKHTLREWGRDGLIPWVGEIYFMNNSDDSINVYLHALNLNGQISEFNSEMEIRSKDVALTAPLVILGLNYGIEFEIGLSFTYNHKLEELRGVAKRLTVDEVNLKYAMN